MFLPEINNNDISLIDLVYAASILAVFATMLLNLKGYVVILGKQIEWNYCVRIFAVLILLVITMVYWQVDIADIFIAMVAAMMFVLVMINPNVWLITNFISLIILVIIFNIANIFMFNEVMLFTAYFLLVFSVISIIANRK
jgi:hypothetical protein